MTSDDDLPTRASINKPTRAGLQKLSVVTLKSALEYKLNSFAVSSREYYTFGGTGRTRVRFSGRVVLSFEVKNPTRSRLKICTRGSNTVGDVSDVDLRPATPSQWSRRGNKRVIRTLQWPKPGGG